MPFFSTALQGTQYAFMCTFVHQKFSRGFLNGFFKAVLVETQPVGVNNP